MVFDLLGLIAGQQVMVGARACRVDDVPHSCLPCRIADGLAPPPPARRSGVGLVEHEKERLRPAKCLVERYTVVEAAVQQLDAKLPKSF